MKEKSSEEISDQIKVIRDQIIKKSKKIDDLLSKRKSEVLVKNN